MQEKQNNNLVAIIIGFCLILLIAAITFFKPSTQKNNPTPNSATANDVLTDNLRKAAKISSDELSKKILNNEKITILDIRSESAYIQEHLLNSKNVPLPSLTDALAGLEKEWNYAVVDSGISLDTTALAISLLTDAGFQNISYLDGGFSAWKNGYGRTISAGDPNSFTDQSKVNYIQSDKLKEIMTTESNFVIIDVRKSDQFTQGHLKNSVNIYLEDIEKRKKDLLFGKKIILYDDNGLGAFKAAVRLFDMGFLNTFALSDGLDAWMKKNFEIVK